MSSSARLGPPENLSTEHKISEFDSGEPLLDEWLKRRALQNEASGASRTYVVCTGKRVAGYYSLAVGAVAHVEVSGRVRRNMPDPIPVMLLARLAVDRSSQGQGIGAGLLRDAVLRTVQAGDIAGMRAILVHAISDAARRFYEGYGFRSSPLDPMTLTITVTEGRKLVEWKGRT